MNTIGTRQWLRIGSIVVVAIILSLLFSRILAPGYDVNRVFYPAVRAVWQGQSAYVVDLFTNPPWTLLPLLPLGWFSPAIMHGVLVTATLLAMFWVMRDYKRFKWSYPLAVISMPFLAMLWVGQIEVFSLVGALLAYRAVMRHKAWLLALGVLLMLIKPQETWVIIGLLMIASARQWSLREWVTIVVGVIGVVVIISAVLGFDWLARILSGPSYAGGWQNFSLWQLGAETPRGLTIGAWLALLAVVVWSLSLARVSRLGLALAAVGSNLLSPYLTGPHLLMTLCFGWGMLFDLSTRWGIIAYLTSLTPLLRLGTGNQAWNQWDIVFPLTTLAGLLMMVRHAPALKNEAT